MSTRLIITGAVRLGGDAVLKELPDGRPVAEFSVANEYAKDQTDWHRVSFFGPRAVNLTPYLKKGTLIMLTGRPKPARAWARQDGSLAAAVDIIADDVQLLTAQPKTDTIATPAEATVEEEVVFV